MIKEAYVSYEIAKLLNEKGFSEEVNWYYDSEGFCEPCSSWVKACPHDYYPMPTLQMVCAWLREEKNIVIVIEPHAYDYPNEKTSSYVFSIWKGDNYIETYSNSKLRGISYLTYEDAVESAIKYCLENLI